MLNLITDTGERGHKHHQFMTREHGYHELMKHIHGAVTIMNTVTHHDPKRAWTEFMRRIQRWRPRINTNVELDFIDEGDDN